MEYFTMRLVAQEATIRGVVVGDDAYALPFPAPSMITGMIGAAFGVDRREEVRLQSIQNALQVAWLIHRNPVVRMDFQTADLSSPHMQPAWAWDGGDHFWIPKRGGASGNDGKKILNREFVCNVDMTAVIGWTHPTHSAAEVLERLDQPHYHLSIGSRWALPEVPVAGRTIEARSLRQAVDRIVDEHPPGAILRSHEPLGLGQRPEGLFSEVASRMFDCNQYARFGAVTQYVTRTFV